MSNETPRCICGHHAISGKYYTDYFGQNVCESHYKAGVESCVCCHRFIRPGDGYPIHDSPMIMCRHCRENIMHKEDAKKVVKFVHSYYENSPLGEIRNWKLAVADYQTMVDEAARAKIDGFCLGLASLRDTGYRILMYRFLSEIGFAHVLAHEMLHIWQWQHGLNPPPLFCEGFCELGSFLVTTQIRHEEAMVHAQVQIDSELPIYGDGARMMIEIYRRGGWPAAIQALVKASK